MGPDGADQVVPRASGRGDRATGGAGLVAGMAVTVAADRRGLRRRPTAGGLVRLVVRLPACRRTMVVDPASGGRGRDWMAGRPQVGAGHAAGSAPRRRPGPRARTAAEADDRGASTASRSVLAWRPCPSTGQTPGEPTWRGPPVEALGGGADGGRAVDVAGAAARRPTGAGSRPQASGDDQVDDDGALQQR